MEHHGVLVDRERLRTQSREFARQLQELLLQAHREAGHEFNIESPKQLQQILFERLQLPVRRKTPTGQPSTAEDVLEELAASYALPRIVLEYRALAKLKSTYTDKLPELVNERTGRIHTNYAQAVAATGRLSSVDPNLQNIPVRRAEGRRIRQAFIAPPGHVLLAADYSQIELRIMAHLSGDESLRAAFAADRDVHQATAAEVFGVELAAVTRRPAPHRQGHQLRPDLRHVALRPGAQPRHRARRRAAQYVERYFQRYPGVKRFMDNTRAQARETGLRRDGVRSAPVPAGHPLGQPAAAPVRRAQRHQRAHAGHGGRHHQARHDRGRRLVPREQPPRRGSSCRCTTSWCSRCPRDAVDAVDRGRARAHGERGRPERAAAGRRRRGRQLGRGALSPDHLKLYLG